MKIRTMQLMGGGKSGGAELFFIRFVQALAARPEQVEVLPVVRRGSWAAARLSEAGIRYATAGFGGMFDLSSKVACRRLAAEFQPNVCMTWMNRATRFMPQPPRGTTPLIGGWARVARLGGYYSLKHYRGCVSNLVGNTQDIVDYCVQSGWNPAQVAHIGNFIPQPELPQERSALRRQVRSELDIPQEATMLLMAARLHAVKGYDVALRALAVLPKDTYLMVAGEGPDGAMLKALAAELGVAERVRWNGWAEVERLRDLAMAADVWLVPSRHEPLGNSVLDAWAHEVPVIAADAAGPASLIADGKTGLLVPINNENALAAAVQRLWRDRQEQGGVLTQALTAQGLETLNSLHGEEVVVQRYLDYYRSLIRVDAALEKPAA